MVEFNPFALKRKTIFVVGASSGIGREIAIECSKMGGKIVVCARSEENLKSVLDEMDGNGNTYITADITNQEDLTKLVSDMPVIDGLVISAGIGGTLALQLKGATLILIGNFANLKVFFEAMEKYKATGFGMVPAVWEYITKLSGNRIAQFADSLRYIEIGSAPMSIEAKQRLIGLFPNTRICMHYGLTEASRSFFMEFHQYKDNLDTIGMPTSEEVEAKIMNDNGTEMPTGQQGEICVRGNMVMSRYLLDKDNAAAFFGDYFRTGDFGFKNENGLYYMVGRKKELINIGGKKISPLTIEEAIKSLGVIDCAVVPVKDPKGILGEVPKAFIQKMGCQLSFDEIRHGLSGLLEPYEIPTEYEFIARIPKTATGKVQRLSLIK